MATTPGLISLRSVVVLTILPIAVGWGLLLWITGGFPDGRLLTAGWIGTAAGVAAGLFLWWSRRRTRRSWEERLHVLGDAGEEFDIVALAERFRAESTQAAAEVKALSSDLNRLTEALAAELEGRGAEDWPEAGPTVALSRLVRELIGDRSQDAAAASELLGLWIEELESARRGLGEMDEAFSGFRAEIQGVLSNELSPNQALLKAGQNLRSAVYSHVVPTAKAEGRVLGTRGGSKREPADSWLTLLSPVFEAIRGLENSEARTGSSGRRLQSAADRMAERSTAFQAALEVLETDARRLRRRLGGADAKELTEDDFVP